MNKEQEEAVIATKQFEIEVYVKDPDAFGEICHALGEERRKWFQFSEYATISMTCEIHDGKPVIVSAEFGQVKP